MKIIVVGATGTIGKAVLEALSDRHEVIGASRSSSDYPVDILDQSSIKKLLESVAPFDALISATGQARFKPLGDLSDEDFQFSLANKLMGQVNLVRLGAPYLTDNGAIVLTSGVLANEPMPGSAAISLVNAGLEGFARVAALELPRGIRINVVSPPWVSETLAARGMTEPQGLPAATVAKAYLKAIEEPITGQVLDARSFV
ncbi:short chain dehydrogenase [Leptolyngbya ohadii]|uniref:short chain dehydrogenase n=1 Tax=Leptolyngbya ohadii TaxID=1962290 RepID=UPI000B59B741|nr:short chain dehydrogenase [Leptolyngbya ohadii]